MSEGRGDGERERRREKRTVLLILFHTAKFSIQHVSPVIERGRDEE